MEEAMADYRSEISKSDDLVKLRSVIPWGFLWVLESPMFPRGIDIWSEHWGSSGLKPERRGKHCHSGSSWSKQTSSGKPPERKELDTQKPEAGVRWCWGDCAPCYSLAWESSEPLQSVNIPGIQFRGCKKNKLKSAIWTAHYANCRNQACWKPTQVIC